MRATFRLRLLELVCDRVRRPFPDAVEPVDEDLDLCPAGLIGREEGRLGMALLQQRDDRRRVGDDLVTVDEYRHQGLAAHRLDGRPVGGIDVDPFDLEALVPCGEGDALDVRRERDAKNAWRHPANLLRCRRGGC
jgi:hypothetical protein